MSSYRKKCGLWKYVQSVAQVEVRWKATQRRVKVLWSTWSLPRTDFFLWVGLLGSAVLTGGKFLPKLNTSRRPIAYKYREGNVKRTLKRELKVFETVNDQAMNFIDLSFDYAGLWRRVMYCNSIHLNIYDASTFTDCVWSEAILWYVFQIVDILCKGTCVFACKFPDCAKVLTICSSYHLYKWDLLTRLETRTKECNACASIWCIETSNAKWKCRQRYLCSGAQPCSLWFQHRSVSSFVRDSKHSMTDTTRKMVSYTCAGWSQGKLWWKLVAILTCKSFVWREYRGERLIEPSSSWFPPKFPPG